MITLTPPKKTEKTSLIPSMSNWPKSCQRLSIKDLCPLQHLVVENEVLKEEIRTSRESAEITASLVVKQFEETDRILARFQVANAQRKAVLDSATNIAIIATDQSGTITVFNKGAEILLGYKAEEIIGRETPLIFHLPNELEARAEALIAEFQNAVEGIDVFFQYAKLGWHEQLEWTYVRKDGGMSPVTLSINPLRDPDGILNGILCIASDITEKRRSELALKESERNYRLLINNIPNIVFKAYEDSYIDFFDDKIEALTGYSKELFLSRKMKWTDIIIPEDQETAKMRFVEALKGDRQYIREYRVRKKNGDIVWVQASSQIVCDADGRIDFISGAFLDITERKAAEAALHDSEVKYRSLFDSGPNPIFVIDSTSFKILDVNPAAIDTYGFTKEELLGRDFSELGEFETREHGLALDAANWPNGCFIDQRTRHQKKDGTPFYLRVKACPIKYAEHEAIILAAITEAIEKDAQLFQSSKMKTLGEMSAGIAHELTQPLNAIKIGNDFLMRMIDQGKTIRAEDLNRVATLVTSQVQRASDIINRLREFGRRPDFKKEPIDLNSVITNVMQIIGQQLILNNVSVLYDLDPDLPKILANHNRLEQVVFNLVSNARDAIEQLSDSSSDSSIRKIIVETYTEGRDVICAVEDTGVGIPDEVCEKIFEPFFTTKEVGKGMGLGLAICYGIVRSYDGTITVRSKAGQGTRFELRFARP
jgi:PAS domain S-box-containing protein